MNKIKCWYSTGIPQFQIVTHHIQTQIPNKPSTCLLFSSQNYKRKFYKQPNSRVEYIQLALAELPFIIHIVMFLSSIFIFSFYFVYHFSFEHLQIWDKTHAAYVIIINRTQDAFNLSPTSWLIFLSESKGK